MYCPKCNQPVADGIRFCIHCGANLEESAPVANEPAAAKPASTFVADAIAAIKKIPRKYLAFGGIGVAAIALILVVIMIVSSFASAAVYALYIKEDEMMMSKLSGGKTWQISADLMDDLDLSDSGVADLADSMSYSRVKLTKDGKKLFYPDHLSTTGSNYDLYYKATTSSGEGTKIASNVESYQINAAGSLVIYLDIDGNLYSHNLKDKTKIASDVEGFVASADCKKIYWGNEDQDLYFKDGNKDKEKVVSEVDNIEYINKNFTSVYYTKDDNLYVKQANKDKEKLASDIADVIAIYDNGSAYYTKSIESDDDDEDEVKTLYDYVKDDMLEEDEEILEEGYPSYYDDDYEEKYELYWEASSRENLRDSLKSWELYDSSASVYKLCFYDGKKETSLTSEYVSSNTYSYTTPVVVYSTQVKEEIDTIKFSDLWDEYNVDDDEEYVSPYDIIVGETDSETTMYVAVKAKTTQFDQDDASNFIINEKGNTIFYLDDKNEPDMSEEDPDIEYTATLYKMTISGDKAKKPEKYDEDVNYNGAYYENYLPSVRFIDNDSVLYVKGYDDEKREAELFVDKKSVAGEVFTSYIYSYEDEKFYFFTDYDVDDQTGTLNYYNGSKVVKVEDDVHYDYTITHEGKVLYFCDYSDKHYTGDLYCFSGSKSTKLDIDVSGVISYTYVTGEKVDLYGN